MQSRIALKAIDIDIGEFLTVWRSEKPSSSAIQAIESSKGPFLLVLIVVLTKEERHAWKGTADTMNGLFRDKILHSLSVSLAVLDRATSKIEQAIH
jgi:hypothetical protein